MKLSYMSFAKTNEATKGVEALEAVLITEGLIPVKSKITPGMTHFVTTHYLSPVKPGMMVTITRTVFHVQIEAILLVGDAKTWLTRLLKKSLV